MRKIKILPVFLVVFAAAILIGGTMVSAEAGSPVGVYCWELNTATGTPLGEIELAFNDDAPKTLNHLSAVGIWRRIREQACVPLHGTAQLDRGTGEFYEIALSYEDIVQVQHVQGHFHAIVYLKSLGGPFAYQDENDASIFSGMMTPIDCPIKCP